MDGRPRVAGAGRDAGLGKKSDVAAGIEAPAGAFALACGELMV
ncbi:hypothetical protein OPKNFCMD_2677 [Methylobacterium crusticola]|uniref:Uncharacterized protein n=1 Tax=Methylobacterium crusticola TaxID=1697972 RepID=A0ABQ4QZ70_9HYPH|nr:hypothetical protein OPKNFCMD_2677 [Methylobacterium crusticola]